LILGFYLWRYFGILTFICNELAQSIVTADEYKNEKVHEKTKVLKAIREKQ